RSRGEPYRLMVMLMVITAIASPFLDNVTTIMLVAPVTVVVCDRLRIPAQPYLIAEVLASNIGGVATLIGDPPNIIIGSRAHLSFNDFLIHLGPVVVIATVAFVAVLPLLFRGTFGVHADRVAEVMSLNERDALLATMLILVVSAIVSGIIDNIPYVATMTPVVADLASTIPDPGHVQAMWWALAIGAGFGGNMTAVGASANVVMVGIAEREGYP